SDNGTYNGAVVGSSGATGASSLYKFQDNPSTTLTLLDDFGRDADGSPGYQTTAGQKFLGTTNKIGDTALGVTQDVNYGSGQTLTSGWIDSIAGAPDGKATTFNGVANSSSSSAFTSFMSFTTTPVN